MAYNTYILGQVVELQDAIADPDTSIGVDDASEAFNVYEPDGTLTTISPTHDGTGLYSTLYTPDQVGWHEYIGISTGLGAGASRKRFYVSPVP